MELKMKYQYTNFVYPYIVEEKNYKKYIQKLLKNNKCKTRFFEKEKDKELYKYFLPNIRKFMFNNFSFSREKIAEFDRKDRFNTLFKELAVPYVYHYVCGGNCTDLAYEDEYPEELSGSVTDSERKYAAESVRECGRQNGRFSSGR